MLDQLLDLDALVPRYRPSLLSVLGHELVARCTPAPVADARYRDLGPLVWAHERLSLPLHTLVWSLAGDEYLAHRWDGTKDPFAAASLAVAQGKDVGIESATGTGKTFWLAILTLWFLDCWEDALVVTSAPKEKQLTLHMWKEIAGLWPEFKKLHPQAELTHLRILMRPGNKKWAAHGFATGVGADEESATKAQGFHQPHMLIITEETPGMHHAVMTAFANTCTGDHNIRVAVGNPDAQHDELHKFCTRPSVAAIRVSALDHPNVVTGRDVVPGAVSKKKVEERRVDYGEGSRLYESRVRGVCPTEGAESLIRWALLVAAADRHKARDPRLFDGPIALGVDVANSENGDKAAIARGTGAFLESIDTYACPDSNLLASQRVRPLMEAYSIHTRHVGVDVVGVGAGTVNELKRLGLKVQGLNGGESPKTLARREETFNNLRSQMYWQLRVDLEGGKIALPHDLELFEELVAPTWEPKNGKIQVESKTELKKRLGRSPDKADAVVYWNWVRVTRGAASTGGATV